jgi:nucleotide-binding universal stress UspA family protein
MRWIVGLDLRPDSEGALAAAGRLAEAAKGEPPVFVGVHIIPQARASVRDDVYDEVEAKAKDAAQAAVDKLAPSANFERIDVLPGGDPEDSLSAAADLFDGDVLLIGRHGPRDRAALVRLGRVARRLVRSLPRPVMVVPPDYAAEPPLGGPVVALTDLQRDSQPAVRFADGMAKMLGVELVVVHVVRNPQAAFDPVASQQAAHDKGAVEQWLQETGISGAHAMTASSDVVDAALHTAQSRQASMLVCGSRGLSLLERTYLSSTGTELARFARCPVAVVPATPRSAD